MMIRAGAFVVLCLATQASLLFLYPFSWRRFLSVAVVYTAGTLLALLLLFSPRNQCLVTNRSSVRCGTRPCVALTFDDGPDPCYTPRVLDLLAGKGVKATFFLVGRRMEAHPALVQRLAAEGHAIGNHTYSHPALFCFLTPKRLRDEIERTQEAVQWLTGVAPRYFRSPVGLRHPILEFRLRRMGLEFISWRVRAYDTRPRKPAEIRRRIAGRASPGDVILLHDGYSAGAENMLIALPAIIDDLKGRGYEFVLL